MQQLETLASYRNCAAHITDRWPAFQERRRERLRQRERYGHPAERATENILEDLFTGVLDWSLGDINHQIRYADLLLTRLGVKHLIVEAKGAGSLTWNRRAMELALEQARRYADEQKVRNVAVSDGKTIYAAEIVNGGLHDRCFASLEGDEPPADELFWLSPHGIYRPSRERPIPPQLPAEPPVPTAVPSASEMDDLVHPRYGLPVNCFAYVGDSSDPKTWRLPYLRADGQIDIRRLPKAIQAILTNYRGATVTTIPETAIPDVLVRLACAASTAGKMPEQITETAAAYCQLAEALDQMGRLAEVAPLPANEAGTTTSEL